MQLNKNTWKISIILFLIFVITCSTFLREEQINGLKKYEEETFVMQKEVKIGENKLAAGQRIKLFIRAEKESIRVYAYDADVDILKSRRLLVLYLFNDDFKNKIFDNKTFEDNLFKVVKPATVQSQK